MRSLEKQNRRRTIGADPLAAIIPIDAEQPAPLTTAQLDAEHAAPPEPVGTPPKHNEPRRKTAKPTSKIEEPTTRKKKRTTLNMDIELDDAIRDAVFALSGPEVQMSLVRFVEEGLSAHLKKLERKHNAGETFPKRAGKLRTGRPLTD